MFSYLVLFEKISILRVAIVFAATCCRSPTSVKEVTERSSRVAIDDGIARPSEGAARRSAAKRRRRQGKAWPSEGAARQGAARGSGSSDAYMITGGMVGAECGCALS